LRLNVFFTPSEILHREATAADDIYIVVDVIRATTSMAVMFDQGTEFGWLPENQETATQWNYRFSMQRQTAAQDQLMLELRFKVTHPSTHSLVLLLHLLKPTDQLKNTLGCILLNNQLSNLLIILLGVALVILPHFSSLSLVVRGYPNLPNYPVTRGCLSGLDLSVFHSPSECLN